MQHCCKVMPSKLHQLCCTYKPATYEDLDSRPSHPNSRLFTFVQLLGILFPIMSYFGSFSFQIGYDSSVNPTVANSFATAAYRFGHTLLVGNFKRLNNQYNELQDVDLSSVR